MIHSYKTIHGKTNPKLVVLSSTVSSTILKSMAKIEGIRFEVSTFKCLNTYVLKCIND